MRKHSGQPPCSSLERECWKYDSLCMLTDFPYSVTSTLTVSYPRHQSTCLTCGTGTDLRRIPCLAFIRDLRSDEAGVVFAGSSRGYHRLYDCFTSGLERLLTREVLGLSGDLLATPWNVELYNTRFAMKSLEVDAAWGWCIFGVNTLLTGFIIGRIMYVRHRQGLTACC